MDSEFLIPQKYVIAVPCDNLDNVPKLRSFGGNPMNVLILCVPLFPL